MMDAVVDNVAPQDVADRHRIGEEVHRAIEIGDGQLLHPRHRIAMDDVESRRDSLHGLRPIDVRGFFGSEKDAGIDTLRDVAVALGEVPGQFAE